MSECTLSTVSACCTEEVLTRAVHQICSDISQQPPRVVNHSVKIIHNDYSGEISYYDISVRLDNDPKQVRLLAKGLSPLSPPHLPTRSCSDLENEVTFYSHVVPSFRDFGRHQNRPDTLLFIPRCYFATSDGRNDFLLLENVTASLVNQMDSGQTTPSFDTMLMTMVRLHAVSLAFKHLYPELFYPLCKRLKNTFYSNDFKPVFVKIMAHKTKEWLTVASNFLDESSLNKFKNFVNLDGFYDKMVSLTKKKEHCVINHGAPCPKNFVNDSSEGAKTKIINFERVYYGPLILDVSVFIFTHAWATRPNRLEVTDVELILTAYQRGLEEQVTLLGAPCSVCPDLKDLKAQWRSSGAFGLGTVIDLMSLGEQSSRENEKSVEQHQKIKKREASIDEREHENMLRVIHLALKCGVI